MHGFCSNDTLVFLMLFTKMGSTKLSFLAILWIFGVVVDAASNDVTFDDKYEVIWGSEHINFLNERRDVQLLMDINSGS